MRNTNENSIEPGLIEKQLQKIISTNRFKASKMLSAFLEFIIKTAIQGHAPEIKEYTIGTKALGRPADFNPATDAVVRIQAGRLRRLLAEYYWEEGLNDGIIIEIPKGSYIPVFKLRTADLPLQNQRINISNTDNFSRENTRQRKVTIIVYPLQNFSSDDSHAHFIDSIGEQLCIDLAKFGHLSLMPYYTLRKAATPRLNFAQINKDYDVDYILTGSVRFSGTSLQINVQLLFADNSALAWTKTYIHQYLPENIYSIQSKVIEQVLNEVADIDGVITKNVISGHLANRTIFGVYNAVYRFYWFCEKYEISKYEQARVALEEASIIEPGNALIWALLSKLYLTNYIFQIEKNENGLKKSLDCAEKALRLDQNCQFAYKALAWYYLFTRKKNDCLDAIERCLELNPKASSIAGNLGFILVCLGEYSRGFKLLLKSKEMNPSPAWYSRLGFAIYYYIHQDYIEAKKWAEPVNIPDSPLNSLIKIAVNGKIKSSAENIDAMAQQELNRRTDKEMVDIINQFIYEKELKKDLAESLALKPNNLV